MSCELCKHPETDRGYKLERSRERKISKTHSELKIYSFVPSSFFCKVEIMFSATTAKRAQRISNSHLSHYSVNQEQFFEVQWHNTVGKEMKSTLQNLALEPSCSSTYQLLTTSRKGMWIWIEKWLYRLIQTKWEECWSAISDELSFLYSFLPSAVL